MKVMLSFEEIRRAVADYIVGNLATAGQDISVELTFENDDKAVDDEMGLIAIVEITPNRSMPLRSLGSLNLNPLRDAIPAAVRVTPKPTMLVNPPVAVAVPTPAASTEEPKRRGRPAGSKNRTKDETAEDTQDAASSFNPDPVTSEGDVISVADPTEETAEAVVEPGVNPFQARLQKKLYPVDKYSDEAEASAPRASIFANRAKNPFGGSNDDDDSDPVSDRLATPEQMAQVAAEEEAETAPAEPKPTKSLFANLARVGQNRNS